jgi:uncharacterized protein YndB with AHSA1/START domain
MANEPIVLERVYDAPVNKVWEAITDIEQMKQWYFDLKGFRPEEGCEFSFAGGTEEKSYLHLCTVIEVVKMKKFSHSWRYDGYSGNTKVTWELSSEGNGTRVRLTHTGLESFPASNPDFAKGNFEKGWTSILDTALKDYLAK